MATPSGSHHPRVLMAAPGPSPRAIAGPEQDVMERIRRFYQFWLNKQPDAQGVDLEDFDMVLNPGMARHYRVDTALTVSGFVVRGYYRGRWNPSKTEWVVDVEPDEPLEPFAQSEMTAEARGRRSKEDLSRSSQLWRTNAKAQKEPWRKFFERSLRNLDYKRVPNLFSAPRMMPLRPLPIRATYPQKDMQRWIATCDKPFYPYKKDSDTAPYDHWLQLKSSDSTYDEMKRGSTRTPLSSTFLLTLVDQDGATSRSIIVSFHIVKIDDVDCRPWQATDGLPPQPDVELPPQVARTARPMSLHSRTLPLPNDTGFYNPITLEGYHHLTQADRHGEQRDITRNHSLSHRKQSIYGQEYANGNCLASC